MKKVKTNLELMMGIRRQWTMNPVTRVQDNQKKNKKKQRQKDKRLCSGSEE